MMMLETLCLTVTGTSLKCFQMEEQNKDFVLTSGDTLGIAVSKSRKKFLLHRGLRGWQESLDFVIVLTNDKFRARYSTGQYFTKDNI